MNIYIIILIFYIYLSKMKNNSEKITPDPNETNKFVFKGKKY